MAVQLDLPSAFTGEPDQQLRQVYSYLYQLSEQLTNALNTISADQFVAEDRNVLTNLKDGELPAAADKTIKAQGSTLKSLIVKTADRIEQQMDVLEQNFSSNYVAQSEFGTYKNEIENKVHMSADGVKTTIEALEVTLNDKIGQTDFSQFKKQLRGYITQGKIEINGEREIGIVIGTEVKSHEVDGHVYIDEQHELVTITSNRMSFWLNNAEVAYFANDGMSINQANVATEIVLGNVHFIYKESGVIDVKWEGGN